MKMSTNPFANPAVAAKWSVYTAGELLKEAIPPPVQIVEGLFVEGKDAIIGGAYGIGKTGVCMQIGAGIATGETVFGLPVTRAYRVLYIDLELGKSEAQQRLRAIRETCQNPELFDANFLYLDGTPDNPLSGKIKLDNGGSSQILAITQESLAEVVIVDNLSLATDADLSEATHCMALRKQVSALRQQNPNIRLFLLPAHVTKPSLEYRSSLLKEPRQWLSRIRGSGKLLDHFTIRLGLDVEVDANEDEFYVLNGISSHGEISPICLEKGEEGYLFRPHSDRALKAKTLFTPAEWSAWTAMPPTFTWADLIRQLGTRSATGQRMLRKARNNGLVIEDPKGTYGKVDTADTGK
jgi:hypothetical protein